MEFDYYREFYHYIIHVVVVTSPTYQYHCEKVYLLGQNPDLIQGLKTVTSIFVTFLHEVDVNVDSLFLGYNFTIGCKNFDINKFALSVFHTAN